MCPLINSRPIRLEGDHKQERAVATNKTETVECGLVLRSIGYQGVNLDPSLPFNESTGTIPNTDNRVQGHTGKQH